MTGQRLAPVLRVAGDARPGTLLYLYVDDVHVAARACGDVAVVERDWGREFEVTDLDGNRVRVGTPLT